MHAGDNQTRSSRVDTIGGTFTLSQRTGPGEETRRRLRWSTRDASWLAPPWALLASAGLPVDEVATLPGLGTAAKLRDHFAQARRLGCRLPADLHGSRDGARVQPGRGTVIL